MGLDICNGDKNVKTFLDITTYSGDLVNLAEVKHDKQRNESALLAHNIVIWILQLTVGKSVLCMTRMNLPWLSGVVCFPKTKPFVPSSDHKPSYTMSSLPDMTTGRQHLFLMQLYQLLLRSPPFCLRASLCEKQLEMNQKRKCVMLLYSSKNANEVPLSRALNIQLVSVELLSG